MRIPLQHTLQPADKAKLFGDFLRFIYGEEIRPNLSGAKFQEVFHLVFNDNSLYKLVADGNLIKILWDGLILDKNSLSSIGNSNFSHDIKTIKKAMQYLIFYKIHLIVTTKPQCTAQIIDGLTLLCHALDPAQAVGRWLCRQPGVGCKSEFFMSKSYVADTNNQLIYKAVKLLLDEYKEIFTLHNVNAVLTIEAVLKKEAFSEEDVNSLFKALSSLCSQNLGEVNNRTHSGDNLSPCCWLTHL